jgi:cobalt/nickel transport system permease protein
LLVFIRQARPDLLTASTTSGTTRSSRRLLAGIGGTALVVAGALSWFASSHPDGLEWSIERATNHTVVVAPPSDMHAQLSTWQTATALFKDYTWDFQKKSAYSPRETSIIASKSIAQQAWPVVDLGTSLAGIVGGMLTLSLIAGVGYLLRRFTSRPL